MNLAITLVIFVVALVLLNFAYDVFKSWYNKH